MIGYPFVRYVHDRMAKEITDPYYAALARHLLFCFTRLTAEAPTAIILLC